VSTFFITVAGLCAIGLAITTVLDRVAARKLAEPVYDPAHHAAQNFGRVA
jgi:hypothetical protein